MPLPSKPTDVPRFGSNALARVEPPETGGTGTTKDTGVIPGRRTPAQYVNWIFYTIYTWVLWVQSLTDQALTWTDLQTFHNGILVSSTTAARTGVDSTGGASNGPGVKGTGGSGNGRGLWGQGTGNAPGVYGVGGTTAPGSQFIGSGSLLRSAVVGFGNTGGSAGDGGYFQGLHEGTGATGESGVDGVGVGLHGIGHGNSGVWGEADGFSFGVFGSSSVANGHGGGFSAGPGGIGVQTIGGTGATGHGLTAAAGSSTAGARAAKFGQGNVEYTGTQPAKTASAGGANVVAALSHIKACARLVAQSPLTFCGISDANADGFNVASVATSGGALIVTMAQAMATAHFIVYVNGELAAGQRRIYSGNPLSTTTFQIDAAEFDNPSHAFNSVDLSNDTTPIHFIVCGRQ